MGRGVAVPEDAMVVAYTTVDDEYLEFFDDYIDWLQEYLCGALPSLYCERDVWLGNELHVFAANDLAMFGVSNYGYIVAIWIVPKYEHINIAEHWICQVAHYVEDLDTMYRVGIMSNGVSVYKRIEKGA